MSVKCPGSPGSPGPSLGHWASPRDRHLRALDPAGGRPSGRARLSPQGGAKELSPAALEKRRRRKQERDRKKRKRQELRAKEKAAQAAQEVAAPAPPPEKPGPEAQGPGALLFNKVRVPGAGPRGGRAGGGRQLMRPCPPRWR